MRQKGLCAHHDFVRAHCCMSAVKHGARGLNVADTIACLTSPVPERACATASRRLLTSAAPLPSLGRGPPVGASVRGGRRGPALPALGPAHRRSSLPLAICLLLATFSLRPDLPATVHALLVSPPELISLATRSAHTLGHSERRSQLPALLSCRVRAMHSTSRAMLCLEASGPYQAGPTTLLPIIVGPL